MRIGTVLDNIPCVMIEVGEDLHDAGHIFTYARASGLVLAGDDGVEKVFVIFKEARLKGKPFTHAELQTRIDQIQAGRPSVARNVTQK